MPMRAQQQIHVEQKKLLPRSRAGEEAINKQELGEMRACRKKGKEEASFGAVGHVMRNAASSSASHIAPVHPSHKPPLLLLHLFLFPRSSSNASCARECVRNLLLLRQLFADESETPIVSFNISIIIYRVLVSGNRFWRRPGSIWLPGLST